MPLESVLARAFRRPDTGRGGRVLRDDFKPGKGQNQRKRRGQPKV